MNCKPNDLAVVVKDECYLIHPLTLERAQILKPGTIVRVMRIGARDGYWEIEEPLHVRWKFETTGSSGVAIIHAICDTLLRPLKSDGITHDEVADLYAPAPAMKARDIVNEALRRLGRIPQ